MSLAARLLALLILAPLPAVAGDAVTPWGDAEIPYDTALWRIDPAAGGASGIVITCLAADCPEAAQVYATIEAPNGSAEEERWRGPVPIDLHAPALPFLAYQLWSGCRALDAPVLSAAVVFRERLYRLVTALGGGCNFGPQIPLSRFTALVEGIRPRDFRVLAIGGIRIAYDAGRWSTGPESAGGGAKGVSMTCTLRECRSRRGEPSHVSISATRDAAGTCVPVGEPAEGSLKEGGTADFGGLSLRLWTTFSGCRARTPPQRNACGVRDGTVYRFASGAHFGCSAGIEGVPEALFREILSGITVAGNPSPAP
jgi:hypothetical protein